MNAMRGTHCGLKDKKKCNNIFASKDLIFCNGVDPKERFSSNHPSKCKYSTEFITAIFFV